MALRRSAYVILAGLAAYGTACAAVSGDNQPGVATGNAPGDESPATEVTTGVDPTDDGATDAASVPSQSISDATRDQVATVVAALPFEDRVSPLVEVASDEGTWMLSQLNPRLEESAEGCRLGDPDDEHSDEAVCIYEYGEVLLVSDDQTIVKAIPLPAMMPSWILVADEAVYAGRIGDGALPDSGVVRIDRASRHATVVVVPAAFDGGDVWPADWRLTPSDLTEEYSHAVGFATEGATGVPTSSWIGPVVVDVPALESFIDRVAESQPPTTSALSTGDQAAGAWPSTEVGPATECVYEYPDNLADRPIAFDGTVLGISRGEYVDDAAATPVELTIQVNKVYRGDITGTITMHTFDFSPPDQTSDWDPTGIRILAAAGESLDVMGCGFTRPYTDQDADIWATTFER